MDGKGDTGTFIRAPSDRRIDTELPTKSSILGLRPNSFES